MGKKAGGISRYWVGVLWSENLRSDWQEEIGAILQLPYCYCVHDRDKNQNGDLRKSHVHLIVAWPNTTTEKQALKVIGGLSAPDQQAVNQVYVVYGMRYMYNYLIHDTEDARKKGKTQYLPEERICGNGFDIGFLEQLSVDEKNEALREMVDLIKLHGIINAMDFWDEIMKAERATVYLEVYKMHSGLIQKLLDGNYQRIVRANNYVKKDGGAGLEKKIDDIGLKVGDKK